MSTRRQKREKAAKPGEVTLSHDEVERRAYEIFRGRGEEPGDPTQDWLEAERQLLEETRRGGGRGAPDR